MTSADQYSLPPDAGGARDLGEPALSLPYYGAPFAASIRRFFTKYFTFSGRASRSEFWWWILLSFAVSVLTGLLGAALTGEASYIYEQPTRFDPPNIISTVFGLATFIPSLAVTWRRLHDTDRSGAWFFISFIPIAGWIVLLVFLVQGPKPEGRRFDI